MPKSSKKAAHVKVPRPADFPLFVHKSGKHGRWCKKVRGRFQYFGGVDPESPDYGAQVALELWLDQKDDLLAGRTPRVSRTGVTLRDLANQYMTSKLRLLESGEIVNRTYSDCMSTCKRLLEFLGADRLVDDLIASDFGECRQKMAKRWGPVRLGNEIQKTRSIFKFAYDEGIIDRPVRYGQSFNRPSQKTLRIARNSKGPKLFTPKEIRTMLDGASVNLHAMILLAIGCGFGNADCAKLPFAALDLKKGWVNFPRVKTGVPRRAPLWPETVKALKAVIANRVTPRNEAHKELVFINRKHDSYFKPSGANPITRATTTLLTELGIHRSGISFYTLRHCFQTVGDGALDIVATRAIMGHADAPGDMSAVYREGVSDARLLAVSDHIHQWLWPPKKVVSKKGKKK